MKTNNKLRWIMTICALVGLSLQPAAAQEDDNTGTNPVNFTYDFTSWMEVQTLEGDNSITRTAFAYSIPLGTETSFRFRAYKIDLSLGSGPSASTTTGFGDMDARFIWVPAVSQRGAIALGLEATFNTASQPVLGSGKTTLGPQVFLVFFNPLGIKGSILAPAYQWTFDVGGEDSRADINRSAFDLFFVLVASNKKRWGQINATAVIDHENDKEFGTIKVNAGQLMFGPISSFIKPGIGIGSDRPYEWNVEFGFKFVWK